MPLITIINVLMVVGTEVEWGEGGTVRVRVPLTYAICILYNNIYIRVYSVIHRKHARPCFPLDCEFLQNILIYGIF